MKKTLRKVGATLGQHQTVRPFGTLYSRGDIILGETPPLGETSPLAETSPLGETSDLGETPPLGETSDLGE